MQVYTFGEGVPEGKRPVVTINSGQIQISAPEPGDTYTFASFEGSFYKSVFQLREEVPVGPSSSAGYSSPVTTRTTYIVGREDLIDDIVIHPSVNDIFIFDFKHNSNKETFELKLGAGKYTPSALVDEIQARLVEQLEKKDMSAELLQVKIGGVESGTAFDDQNKLVIKHIPPDDGANNSGTYIIDGVRGSAAHSIFYRTDGDPVPTYTVGSLDLSNGARIQGGINDTLTMDIDGHPKSITLEPEDYPPEDLIEAINLKLNNPPLGLTASYFEGRLKLSFKEPGMHTIEAIRGNAKGTLFFEVDNRSSQREEHFQVGANAGQALVADHSRVSTELLRINTVTILKADSANKALGRLDGALSLVSSERSRLGALQNRLEIIIQNNENYSENLTVAESRIRDADMAQEVMEQVKSAILQQSATAMLAQANLAPQSVLQLLS